MEWLFALLPIGLVVLVCGGLHMLMMRGMHGGHGSDVDHRTDVADPRVDELERQVSRLQERLGEARRNGSAQGQDVDERARVLALPRGTEDDHSEHRSERGCH